MSLNNFDMERITIMGGMLLASLLTFYFSVGFFTGRNRKLGRDTDCWDDMAETMLPITQSFGGLVILAGFLAIFSEILFIMAGYTEPGFWSRFTKIVGLLAALFISPLVAYGLGRVIGTFATKSPADEARVGSIDD